MTLNQFYRGRIETESAKTTNSMPQLKICEFPKIFDSQNTVFFPALRAESLCFRQGRPVPEICSPFPDCFSFSQKYALFPGKTKFLSRKAFAFPELVSPSSRSNFLISPDILFLSPELFVFFPEIIYFPKNHFPYSQTYNSLL